MTNTRVSPLATYQHMTYDTHGDREELEFCPLPHTQPSKCNTYQFDYYNYC
jgi:hypothetical protein